MDSTPPSFEDFLFTADELDIEPPSFEDFQFTAEELDPVYESARIQSRGKEVNRLLCFKRPRDVPDTSTSSDEALDDTETNADLLAATPVEAGAGSQPVTLPKKSPAQASGGSEDATPPRRRSPAEASAGAPAAPGQSSYLELEVAMGLNEACPLNMDSASDFINEFLLYYDDLEPSVVDALFQAGCPTPNDPGWEEFLEIRGRKRRLEDPELWQRGDFGGNVHRAFTVEEALEFRTPFHNVGAYKPPDLHPTESHMVHMLDWMRYLIALQRQPRHFLHEENGMRLGRVAQAFNGSWMCTIQILQLDPADLFRCAERSKRLREKVRREEFGIQVENRPELLHEYELEMTRWTSYLFELRRSSLEFASEESRQSFLALVEAFTAEFLFTIKALLGEEHALSVLDVEQDPSGIDFSLEQVALGGGLRSISPCTDLSL